MQGRAERWKLDSLLKTGFAALILLPNASGCFLRFLSALQGEVSSLGESAVLLFSFGKKEMQKVPALSGVTWLSPGG